MNRSNSRYFNNARRMNEALIALLLEKDFEYITVKEICARSGVNRSTFYLHYENTCDLLSETLSMISDRFKSSLPQRDEAAIDISTAAKEDLYFITDKYILPWLEFIKENRLVYKAMHTHRDIFSVERTYRQLFEDLYSPILTRYGLAEEKHAYVMEYYRSGMTALIMKWVGSDCRESTAEIANILKLCVGNNPYEK